MNAPGLVPALMLGSLSTGYSVASIAVSADGVNFTMVAADGGVGDLVPGTSGIVTFAGTLGGFMVHVDTGMSKNQTARPASAAGRFP
jgi:hypothetical protein